MKIKSNVFSIEQLSDRSRIKTIQDRTIQSLTITKQRSNYKINGRCYSKCRSRW